MSPRARSCEVFSEYTDSQFPPVLVATSPTSTHTVLHTSSASTASTATLPSRRARKKSSHAPSLLHTIPATRENLSQGSLENFYEAPNAAQGPIRSDGLTESEDMVKNSQMDLKSAEVEQIDAGQSVAQELMDSNSGRACRSDQNSLMDTGTAGVSVAQELVDPYYGTACSSDQNFPMDARIVKESVAQELMDARQNAVHGTDTLRLLEDVIVLYHTLVQDGALPPSYESSFAELGPYIYPEADRQDRQLHRLTM